jgi:hypothetical protein
VEARGRTGLINKEGKMGLVDWAGTAGEAWMVGWVTGIRRVTGLG